MITTDEISGAITGGYFDGSNAYVLSLYDGELAPYSGQNFYIDYADYTEAADDSWGVLETYDGSDVSDFSTSFYYEGSFEWFWGRFIRFWPYVLIPSFNSADNSIYLSFNDGINTDFNRLYSTVFLFHHIDTMNDRVSAINGIHR